MVIKFYLIILIICSQKICTPVSEISVQCKYTMYVTRKYPYTTEGDNQHKEQNWRDVQIVNTICITIVNSFKSKIE